MAKMCLCDLLERRIINAAALEPIYEMQLDTAEQKHSSDISRLRSNCDGGRTFGTVLHNLCVFADSCQQQAAFIGTSPSVKAIHWDALVKQQRYLAVVEGAYATDRQQVRLWPQATLICSAM